MFALCYQGSYDFEEHVVGDREPAVPITSKGFCHGASGSSDSLSAKGESAPGRGKRRRCPEDEAVEKARLQSLVDSFTKGAVRGCPSAHVDDRRGTRTETLYRIDRNLRHLTLLARDDRRVIAECPIKDIQDIYLLEDGEECFPPQVVRGVEPHERELLLMLVHGGSHEKAFNFCMLEESRESRDRFLESMRVLNIYAANAPAADTNHLSPASARRAR
jgi:hypothetical protein